MATALLLKAGILVGGYIIGKIAAKVVSDNYATETPGSTGFGNSAGNRSTEFPHQSAYDTETRTSNRFWNTENGREVRNPPPPSSTPPSASLKSRQPPPSPSPTQTLPRQTTGSSQHSSSSKPAVPSAEPPYRQPPPSPFPTQTLPRQTTESSQRSSSSCKPAPSKEPCQPSAKPVLYQVTPSDHHPTDPVAKTSYISVQDETLPIYEIPEDLNDLIKKGIVPGVLKRPLSLSTYADYFHALLFAEDHYIEKWDGFEMKYVTLKLHEAAIYKGKGKHKNMNILTEEKEEKIFIEFELDSIPEKRPFLLSRDFVLVSLSGKATEPFKGIVYRVVKSNIVLVEFGEDFHSQHYSTSQYDVKFSFNRICLKRAHQAIAAALDPLFRDFLFPDSVPKNSLVAVQLQPLNPTLDKQQLSAVCQILSHQNPPPYLVEGPLSVSVAKQLSRTGLVVCEAVLQIYRKSPSCRILICAPLNSTCDVITRSLKKEIQESDMFRANAAFRELDGVPVDILSNCQYRRDCFSCPSIQQLKKYKVVVSTFMSSFRLHNEGLMAGHFSHIFLVDASSATEPETMVALANLANKRTAVTITGALGNHSRWVRSNIGRMNGLMTSYFDRIRESKLYKGLDPKVITQL